MMFSLLVRTLSPSLGEMRLRDLVTSRQRKSSSIVPSAPAATITAFIVQGALGDLPHGSIGYQTIFAAGLTLMLFTLACNIAGHMLRKSFREAY